MDGPNSFEFISSGDDGSTGLKSVGFTSHVLSDQGDPATWADWLSRPFRVSPGEKLLWKFRYKITNDPEAPDGEIYADTRGFTAVDGSGNPTNYVGRAGALILTHTAGAWTSAETELEVPAGAAYLDLRFNQIFTFFTTLPWRGTFRLDDVAVYRELRLQADFDANMKVEAADLSAWANDFSMTTGAVKSNGDADGDADVDGNDFLFWQREFGRDIVTSSVAVPEPSSGALLCVALSAAWRRLQHITRNPTTNES